ncbi:MAG: DUF1697 domain-containing protein [Bacteroidetes bacterium]|nr:DUF1697 domain-containing protein [Bacteroidota bacterium]
MTTYISTLRGINVSGQKLIKMADLQKTYEKLGFGNITTYVQSGNVVFTGKKATPKELAASISQQIAKDFGFQVPVLVLSINSLRQIIASNPFLQDSEKDIAFIHITFLSSQPPKFDEKAIEEKKLGGEAIAFTNMAVYLYCPNGYGKTKLTNSFLETKLQVSATTRNWKTTNELVRIAEEISLLNK